MPFIDVPSRSLRVHYVVNPIEPLPWPAGQPSTVPQRGASVPRDVASAPFDPDKPSLVLIHAGCRSCAAFNGQLLDKRLQETFNLVAFERRFHGETDFYGDASAGYTLEESAEEAIVILEALSSRFAIERFSIYAEGIAGCVVGTKVALRIPERVICLTLASPGSSTNSPSQIVSKGLVNLLPRLCANKDGNGDGTGTIPEATLNDNSEYCFGRTSDFSETEGLKRVHNDAFQKRYGTGHGSSELCQLFKAESERAPIDGREDVKCPVLILHGTRDEVVSPLSSAQEWAVSLSDAKGGAQLQEIQDGAHLLSFINHNVVNRTALMVFASTSHHAQPQASSSAAVPVPISTSHHQHPSDHHAHTGGHAASLNTPHQAGTSASATSISFESVFTDEEEKLSDYEAGGYHPVRIGDVYGPGGRYIIVRKLGWGHFSTVCVNKHVALKVVKSATHYTETALDEIKLLQRVVESNPSHPGRRHVVSLLDHFTHRGPNGNHVCMVFEVLGENLLGLIKRYHHRGVPDHICKQIAKQVLLGLDYIHRECGIIHTDLKPENVLICIDDVEAVVRAELETSPAAVPTKMIGVPPSQPRGGAQTPRTETIFITGSQPLPSPSSSYGTSPVIEKLAFQMSKISDSGAGPSSLSGSMKKSESGASAEEVGKKMEGVQLADIGAKKTSPSAPTNHGPSLLSQQAAAAASFPPTSTSPQPPPDPSGPNDSDVTMRSSSTSEMPMPSPPPFLPPNPLQPAPVAGDPTILPPPAPYDPSTLERITVKIADLGNASWTDLHFTNDIQTRQYRSPEAILGAKWGTSVDIWSASAMFFELLTGDYLFDPHPGTRYNKDDDHIAQVIELLGPFPRSIALSGKFSADIFTRKGELKHIHKLKFWPLHSVLMDKYLIPEAEAKYLESFLQPMLHLNPDKRATAREMLDHEWLKGVVVQGEIEAHLLQTGEAEEERKRKVEEGKAVARSIKGMNVESPAVTNASIVDPQLVHALRPIDVTLNVHHTDPPPPPASSALATQVQAVS
ncbi:hypothetical protein JCM10212_003475 [Sporobolomyces blumeae]